MKYLTSLNVRDIIDYYYLCVRVCVCVCVCACVCVCVRGGSIFIPILIERVSTAHARTLHCVCLQFDSIHCKGSNLLLFFEHIFDEGSEHVKNNESHSMK
jgi:hypothetical protein